MKTNLEWSHKSFKISDYEDPNRCHATYILGSIMGNNDTVNVQLYFYIFKPTSDSLWHLQIRNNNENGYTIQAYTNNIQSLDDAKYLAEVNLKRIAHDLYSSLKKIK